MARSNRPRRIARICSPVTESLELRCLLSTVGGETTVAVPPELVPPSEVAPTEAEPVLLVSVEEALPVDPGQELNELGDPEGSEPGAAQGYESTSDEVMLAYATGVGNDELQPGEEGDLGEPVSSELDGDEPTALETEDGSPTEGETTGEPTMEELMVQSGLGGGAPVRMRLEEIRSHLTGWGQSWRAAGTSRPAPVTPPVPRPPVPVTPPVPKPPVTPPVGVPSIPKPTPPASVPTPTQPVIPTVPETAPVAPQPVDSTPPRLQQVVVRRVNRTGMGFELVFSEPIDPSTAIDKGLYRIERLQLRDWQLATSPGEMKIQVAYPRQTVAIGEVVVDASGRSVTLIPVERLSPMGFYQVHVGLDGPAPIRDSAGLVLDGDGDSVAGGEGVLTTPTPRPPRAPRARGWV